MDMDANLDLLQGVQDAASIPNFADPNVLENLSVEKLLEFLEGMDMPQEEKDEMKNTLLQRGNELFDFLKLKGKEDNIMPRDPSSQYMIFLIAILIIAFVFVFFGYKLIKSLVDKEKKKEEKRKQKQQKKKK